MTKKTKKEKVIIFTLISILAGAFILALQLSGTINLFSVTALGGMTLFTGEPAFQTNLEIYTTTGYKCSFPGSYETWGYVFPKDYLNRIGIYGEAKTVKLTSYGETFYQVHDVRFVRSDTQEVIEEYLLSVKSNGLSYSTPKPSLNNYPNGYDIQENIYVCPANQIPDLERPVQIIKGPAIEQPGECSYGQTKCEGAYSFSCSPEGNWLNLGLVDKSCGYVSSGDDQGQVGDEDQFEDKQSATPIIIGSVLFILLIIILFSFRGKKNGR